MPFFMILLLCSAAVSEHSGCNFKCQTDPRVNGSILVCFHYLLRIQTQQTPLQSACWLPSKVIVHMCNCTVMLFTGGFKQTKGLVAESSKLSKGWRTDPDSGLVYLFPLPAQNAHMTHQDVIFFITITLWSTGVFGCAKAHMSPARIRRSSFLLKDLKCQKEGQRKEALYSSSDGTLEEALWVILSRSRPLSVTNTPPHRCCALKTL